MHYKHPTEGGLCVPYFFNKGEIMSKDRRQYMPSSGAGITRYFDEFKSKIQIKPMSVVIILIIVAILILVLHKIGYGILGI